MVVDSEEKWGPRKCLEISTASTIRPSPFGMSAALAVLLCIAAAVAEVPLLHLTKESVRFVEKEVGKFRCSYNGAQGNVTLSMFLRDPELNGPLFTAPSNTSVGQGSLRFDLAMRRDYAGKTLVCNSSDGGIAEMKIGAVRPTIPINVSFSIPAFLDYPLAENVLEFCCEVETKIPAKVFIIGGLTNDKRLQKERRSKTIFCNPKPRPSPEFLHTGWPFACLAESSEGAVYSDFRRLFVFDPKFGASSRPVTLYLEPSVSVSITYNDMQAPLHPMRTFQVCKKTKAGKCPLGRVRVLNVTVERLRHVTFRVKIKKMKRLKARFLQNVTLRANVTFVPEDVGQYQVLFVIELNNAFARHMKLSRKGPQLVVWNHYAEISEERLLTPEVTLGAFGSLTFHLNASVPLQEEELLVLGPTGAPLSAEDLRILHNGTSLRIDFVVSDSAGKYRVAFRNTKANANGRQHGIQVKAPSLQSPFHPISMEMPPASSPVYGVFNFSGLQAPAFPSRVFKVFEIGSGGHIISKNVTVLNVTMKRVNSDTFQANISFVPGRTGRFQILFICGTFTERGPKIIILSAKEKYEDPLIVGWRVAVAVTGVIVGVLIFVFLITFICCRRLRKTHKRASQQPTEGPNVPLRISSADTQTADNEEDEYPLLTIEPKNPNNENQKDAGDPCSSPAQATSGAIKEVFEFLVNLELRKNNRNPEDINRSQWKPQKIMFAHSEPESPVSLQDYFGYFHFGLWKFFPKTIHYERKEEDLQSKLLKTTAKMCRNICGSTHCRIEVDFIKSVFTYSRDNWNSIKTIKDMEEKHKNYQKGLRLCSMRAFPFNGSVQTLVDVLKSLGAQETNQDVETDRKIRCVCFNKFYTYENKNFNATLDLNPVDLSFDGWNPYRYYDRALCLINPLSHETTTAVDDDDVAFDIRIKNVSVAFSGVDEYKKQWSELNLTPPDALTKPGLNGLIRYKADSDRYEIAPRSNILEIQEKRRQFLNFKMEGIDVQLMTSDGQDLKVYRDGHYHRFQSFESWPKLRFFIETENQCQKISELVTRCVIGFMKALEQRKLKFCLWRTFVNLNHREFHSTPIQALRRIQLGASLRDMLGVLGTSEELDLSSRLQRVLEELEDMRNIGLPSPLIPFDPGALINKLRTAAQQENVPFDVVC